MSDHAAPAVRLRMESRVDFVVDSMRSSGAQVTPGALADAMLIGLSHHDVPDALLSTLVGAVACLRLYAAHGLPDVFLLPGDEVAD